MSYSSIKVTDITLPATPGKRKQFNFTIDGNTDCFAFYIYSLTFKDQVINVQLRDPTGNLIPQSANKVFYNDPITQSGYLQYHGSVAFGTPIQGGQGITMGGTWTATIVYSTQEGEPFVKIVERITLSMMINYFFVRINPVAVITSEQTSAKMGWLKDALNKTKTIFTTCSALTIEWDPSIKIISRPKGKITENFWHDDTLQRLIKDNAKDSHSILALFIQDLGVQFRSERGRAGGIPGPQGFLTRFAAVIVDMPSKPDDALIVNNGFLGLVAAHEIGHYLGLTHGSAQLDPANLMYNSIGSYSNGTLSPTQAFVVQHNPITIIKYTDQVKTKLSTVVVTIATGTTSPTWTDGPGTTMSIRFSLGSQAYGFETWVVSNLGQYQAPGTSFSATLPVTNLCLEDIDTWLIICNDSIDPFIGELPIDSWALASVTVIADGTPLDSYTPSRNQNISGVLGLNSFKRKFK